MKYRRMPIEIESPEQIGYDNVKYNLTESSVTDRLFGDLQIDLGHVLLSYGDHIGHLPLREQIAAEYNQIGAQDVLLTVGAASALFIVATSLLDKGDHAVLLDPNYITNIETPRLIGCEYDKLLLDFDSGFKLDIDKLKTLIRPNTKLVSLTYPHNPTGQCISQDELNTLVALAEEHGFLLLLDETYRDMQFDELPLLAADLSPLCISVSSLSKSYGMPGIRLGWVINRNPELQEVFLAAKEQIFVTNSLVDEHIAHQFLLKKHQFWPQIKQHILNNRTLVKQWIENSPYFEWIQPAGGCVCFPRLLPSVDVDIERFYQILNHEFETYVGPGHWFEQSKRHFRVGFGYPDAKELGTGLQHLDQAAEKALS